MKRFHVHIAVNDLDQSIGFYSAMLDARPICTLDGFAQWKVEEPPLLFSITQRGAEPGVNHLGFHVDTQEELDELEQRLRVAEKTANGAAKLHEYPGKPFKFFISDPQSVSWEAHHTINRLPY